MIELASMVFRHSMLVAESEIAFALNPQEVYFLFTLEAPGMIDLEGFFLNLNY